MRFGRKPVKEEAIEQTESENHEEMPEVVEDLNSTGFAMIKWPDKNTFSIVTLKFNPATGNAKVDKVDQIGSSRMETEEEFKIRIGKYFFDQEMKD